MALNWDDDDEDMTELEYRKHSNKVVVHEEVTTPLTHVEQFKIKSPSSQPPLQIQETISITQGTPQPTPRPQRAMAFVPAPARDRFAAFFIDSVLAFYIYWLVGYLFIRFFNSPNMSALHQSHGRLALHLIFTALLVFFYYVMMESVVGATLGKLFCRLRVIEESGQGASLGNVFIRNFLRLVDYPVGFLIAVIAMESTPYNQRLGDRAAKTLVIKKTRRHVPVVDLAHTPLASTLSRMFAEGIDLLFALLLLYGVLLSMNASRPLLFYVIYISLPLIFIFYYTFLEFFIGTTPGKALFKRKVVLENGEPPDGTAALIRNLFRPLDYLLGYPLLILTKRKQRLGDLAADTLVVVESSGRKGFLGSLVAIALILTVAYFGFKNPNNIIKKEYGLGPIEGLKVFVPKLRPQISHPPKAQTPSPNAPAVVPPGEPLPPSTSDQLKLAEFYFATGPAPGQIRQDKIFKAGDLIFAFFKVQGFQMNASKEANLSQDLKVGDPTGKAILDQPEIVKFTKTIQEETPSILFANNIKLPKGSPLGRYRAVFTVHDQVSGKQFSFEENFEMQ